MLDFEEEEIWLRHRLRRMRALLRYAKEIKVEVGLRELIAEAEERLEILEQRQNHKPANSVGREWFVLFALVVVGVAVIAIWQINGSHGEITGTISQTEPTFKQDGTAAHPYSDAANVRPGPIWSFGQTVARSPAFLPAYRSALLEISLSRAADRIE
jgi:hypothetical protein